MGGLMVVDDDGDGEAVKQRRCRSADRYRFSGMPSYRSRRRKTNDGEWQQWQHQQ
uniref:Bm9226 n=1 Tax=Brugia malayi TaxID=6279 RepID=A0A1I9G0Y2_BRUMA|nr:Bm9226 [Brugia malayi]